MSYGGPHEWGKLAEDFSAWALRDPSVAGKAGALSQMCLFMSRTGHGRLLVSFSDASEGRLMIGHRDGSHSSKRLHVQMIADNEIEFYLRENSSPTFERFFQPAEPYYSALERFRKIIESLDWNAPVTGPSVGEKVIAAAKFLSNRKYWGGQK